MPSLRNFGKRMKQLGANVEKNADELVRKVALAVDSTVVMATPVDEGRARSNWQVNLDAPATGVIDAYSPGKEGDTGGENAREAIEQGKEQIAQYKGGTPQAAIHITNNLPYIKRLNDGWSAQAPQGFVEKAIITGVRAARPDRPLTSDV